MVTTELLEGLVARGGRPGGSCSSSTAPWPCRNAIGQVFGSRAWCSTAATHSCWAICRRSSTSRPGRRCGCPGSWTPTRAFGSWSSTRRGCGGSGRGRRPSLREGLAELFTVTRLGLPKALRQCLTTTNIIDASHSRVRRQTNRHSLVEGGDGGAVGGGDLPGGGVKLPRFRGHLSCWGGGASAMPKTRPPYAAEFRQQMVELVRAGRTPEDLAREFEPSSQAIRTWVAQADRDGGTRSDGLRTEEREELRRLRRENRRLREEREILAKATAWFARETRPGRSTGS